nr:YfhO family protein [Chitinophagaceae bacterium]
LNAKYILIPSQQNGQLQVMPNPDAYGPCWLVKNIKFVKDRVEAIQSIGKVNLKDTAILVSTGANNPAQPQWDSTASIRLTHFDNDTLFYEVNAKSPQYAVFSEIYYPAGWNAYLDNQKTNYFNTDYILRGMSVPAGKHTIKFVFEPASYKSGTRIMFISSILILIVFAGGLFMAWRQYAKEQT